jgi:hypothetical protein
MSTNTKIIFEMKCIMATVHTMSVIQNPINCGDYLCIGTSE